MTFFETTTPAFLGLWFSSLSYRIVSPPFLVLVKFIRLYLSLDNRKILLTSGNLRLIT